MEDIAATQTFQDSLHTCLPCWGASSVSNSSFPPIYIMEDSSGGSSIWVPVTHTRELNCVPSSGLTTLGLWRVNLFARLFLCLLDEAVDGSGVCVCESFPVSNTMDSIADKSKDRFSDQ